MKENDPAAQHMENEVARLKTAVEELSVLNDLAIAAGASIDVDQMLDTIVQKSIKAVKAEQGAISLLTGQEGNPFRTLIRHIDRSVEQPAHHLGSHVTGWVLKNKKALLIEDLSADARFSASEEEKKTVRSVLCVPIWSQAKIIGILMMTNKKTGEPFNSEDLRLLSIIASQSGQLIRNSQLQAEAVEKKRMEHELALARRIQSSLLPQKEPSMPGLEFAAYYQPAVEVGGDYYDYFPKGGQQIAVVIADVSGHGASAAMLTTMLKGILNSVFRQFTSVDSAMGEVNLILSQMVPKSMFITMMLMVFDMEKNVMRFSNAGHNPMVRCDGQSGRCQSVTAQGCALNMMGDFKYPMKELPLKRGDLFFIYTDGITEATNDSKDMFDIARLMQSLEETVGQPASKVIDHVKNKLNAFTGKTVQADDVLMIAVNIIN